MATVVLVFTFATAVLHLQLPSSTSSFSLMNYKGKELNLELETGLNAAAVALRRVVTGYYKNQTDQLTGQSVLGIRIAEGIYNDLNDTFCRLKNILKHLNFP